MIEPSGSLPRLCAVGDLFEDVLVLLGAKPRRGTDVKCEISRCQGGSAANVAVHFARLGGAARFVGRVGNDPAAERLLDGLSGSGVEQFVDRGDRTGTVIVLVDPDGERTMYTDRGASPGLLGPDEGWLTDVGILHLPSYSLFEGDMGNTCRELTRNALDQQVPLSIDASSSVLLHEVGKDKYFSFLEECRPSILFCNIDEARVLGLGANHPAPGASMTIVKDGPRPALLILQDGGTTSIPVPDVDKVLDTTGAGDAFAAGFLHNWASGAEPQAAVRFAHETAGRVIGAAGATGV